MSRPIRCLVLWITASVWLCAGTESFDQRIEKTPEGFLIARPGYAYRFPRDHASHPGYKTEWWYYTGHLQSESGERFGFQWTFFRSALRPPQTGRRRAIHIPLGGARHLFRALRNLRL